MVVFAQTDVGGNFMSDNTTYKQHWKKIGDINWGQFKENLKTHYLNEIGKQV